MVLLLAAVMMSGCSQNSGGSAANNNNEMSPDDLEYIPSKVWWDRNGELYVEGSFYNFSSDYDVLELEDAVIYVLDSEGNTLKTININENYVGQILRNDSVDYYFTAKGIEGGGSRYDPQSLEMVLECSFVYGEAENTPYTPDPPTPPEDGICEACGGTGRGTSRCTYCMGSGIDPSWESTKGSSLHNFAEKNCAKCGGSGLERCRSCWGSGKE